MFFELVPSKPPKSDFIFSAPNFSFFKGTNPIINPDDMCQLFNKDKRVE